MAISKQISLAQLNERKRARTTGDVILWALDRYARSNPKGSIGRLIAYSIKARILAARKDLLTKPK